MSIYVDLSAKELRPSSVVDLIEDHAANPGAQQILFKVSAEVQQHFRAARPEGIPVSKEEADEINKFAGVSSQEYFFSKRHECPKCGRLFTFYDVFHSGRRRHGDDYIKKFIAGEGYHIQVHQRDPTLEVDCTKCGTTSVFDDGCYKCRGYTYA